MTETDPSEPRDDDPLNPGKSTDSILADAINGHTTKGLRRIVWSIVIAASIVSLLYLAGAVWARDKFNEQSRTIQSQTETIEKQTATISEMSATLSRRSVVMDYVACGFAYVTALVDAGGAQRTPEEIARIDEARRILDEATATDLDAGETVPQCFGPQHPGG